MRARFARAAARPARAGKPIAVVKAGRTAAAARTAHSHTGALAGADERVRRVLPPGGHRPLRHAGDAVRDAEDVPRRRPAARAASVLVMGASGGDMAMTADARAHAGAGFRAHSRRARRRRCSEMLTDRVTIANPFDIHTYLWFDPPALRARVQRALRAGFDAVGFMLDCPPRGQGRRLLLRRRDR